MANTDSILDTAIETIADLQNEVAILRQQRDFLIGELKVAAKAFAHNGLEGHAWCADKALEMIGGNHAQPD